MLKDHVDFEFVASLNCTDCGETLEAIDDTRVDATAELMSHASTWGWCEIDGKVYCKFCSNKVRL